MQPSYQPDLQLTSRPTREHLHAYIDGVAGAALILLEYTRARLLPMMASRMPVGAHVLDWDRVPT